MSNYINEPVQISQLPQIALLDFQSVAKNYPILHTLETLFIWIIISGAAVTLDILNDLINFPLWAYLALTILIVLSLMLSYFSAKALGYLLRDKDILYKKGLFWRKRTGVSFKRIQHIDITHGPIERKFNLATIKFFTAGGSMADLKITGLSKNDAESLRSVILEKTGLNND